MFEKQLAKLNKIMELKLFVLVSYEIEMYSLSFPFFVKLEFFYILENINLFLFNQNKLKAA